MATIKDVSREAGISIGTVSRVLNNRGYISEKTREKVYETMKRLNYQPNEVARSLSKKSSTIIGLVVPQIENPYFASLTSYIEHFASERDYQILLFLSDGREQREQELIEQCKKNRVAGIILCSGLFAVSNFKDLDCPLVTVERSLEGGTSSVECDNYEGGVKATQHLIEKGCRYLLHLSGVVGNIMPADKRAQGFVDTCEANQIPHIEAPFSEELYEKMEYIGFLEEIFAMHPDIDGVFASSDIIAAQVLQVCARFGKKVPDDIKIVGFDDIPLAKWTVPTLTSVRQPLREMAEMAVNTLISAKECNIVPKQIRMAVELVQRGST